MDDLDERMKAAGMIPLSELISGPQPLDYFMAHTAVCDHDSFEAWLKSKYESLMRMRLAYDLDKREKDEMYEWIVGHAASFGEVLVNWRVMKQRMAQDAQQPASPPEDTAPAAG